MTSTLSTRETTRKPHLPPGIRIYAFGDIHGRADLLQQMFNVVDADLARLPGARAIQVFLGDYVDRGPDSRGTIELLIKRSREHKTVLLKGNHEVMLLEALRDPMTAGGWCQFGGLQTLASYGLRPSLNPTAEEQRELMEAFALALPDSHRTFLTNLKPAFLCGDYFFVHAGVRPGVPLAAQREDDLIWIRNEFLNSESDFGKFIVHGHTPVSSPDRRPNRINIDTGAYATGNLTLLTMSGSSMLAL